MAGYELTTSRLHLRPLQAEDRPPFEEMVSDLEVVRNLARWPYPADGKMIDGFFERVANEPQGGFAITLEGKLIGSIGLGPRVGYMLRRDAWGKRLMSEALEAVQAFSIHELGMSLLTAEVFKDNPASRRVLEKAGWQLVGAGRSYSAARKMDVDDWQFELTAARLSLWQAGGAGTVLRDGPTIGETGSSARAKAPTSSPGSLAQGAILQRLLPASRAYPDSGFRLTPWHRTATRGGL